MSYRKATEDTLRALEVIKPMADELRVDIEADGGFLYCDGQAIGISCNSTFATIMEFIGYLMVRFYKDRFGSDGIPRNVKEVLERYWCSDEYVENAKQKYEEWMREKANE